MTFLESATLQYLDTAKWADSEDGNDEWSLAIWSNAARNEALEHVTDFVNYVESIHPGLIALLNLTADDIGHNFWLSRQGHGTGFWDRGWGEVGDTLHAAAKTFGKVYIYVHDGLIEFG